MSPIIRKKGERFTLPGKYLLLILTIICLLLMLLTFGTNVFNGPLNTTASYIIIPFQKGISSTGSYLSNRSEELAQIKQLISENEALKAEVAELTEQNTLLAQDKYELNKLRKLLELSQTYDSYNKVGARIIGRDSSNWYSSFIIDKGSADGIALDMNVISDGGLVGRVTSVGPSWARVTAIISDNSNVSAMTIATEDNMIVSGDLKLMSDNVISFSQLVDSKNQVNEGDKVVTSNISDKYLPNILVGYIHTIEGDNNNITKSGLLTPAVDFEHLSTVLVITDLKQQYEVED